MNWVFSSGRYSWSDYWNRRSIHFSAEEVIDVVQFGDRRFYVYVSDSKLQARIYLDILPEGLAEASKVRRESTLTLMIEDIRHSWKSIVTLYLVLSAAPLYLVPVLIRASPNKARLQFTILFVAMAWGAVNRIVVPIVVCLWRRNRVKSYFERWRMFQEAGIWILLGLSLLPIRIKLASLYYPMTTSTYWAEMKQMEDRINLLKKAKDPASR